MSFLHVNDLDIEILNLLNNDDLVHLCHSNHHFYQLCQQNKTIQNKLKWVKCYSHAKYIVNDVYKNSNWNSVEITLPHYKQLIMNHIDLFPPCIQNDIKIVQRDCVDYFLVFYIDRHYFFIAFETIYGSVYAEEVSDDVMIKIIAYHLYYYPDSKIIY